MPTTDNLDFTQFVAYMVNENAEAGYAIEEMPVPVVAIHPSR